MPTPAAALARRIVKAMQTCTSRTPQQWVPLETIAQIVMVSDAAFLIEALQVAVDRDWLVIEDSHGLCLTDAGCLFKEE